MVRTYLGWAAWLGSVAFAGLLGLAVAIPVGSLVVDFWRPVLYQQVAAAPATPAIQPRNKGGNRP